MNAEISCPFCHFSKKIPEKKIPATARWAICPQCKQKFEITVPGRDLPPPARGGRMVEDSGENDNGHQGEAPTGLSPWEDRYNTGFVTGFYRTLRDVLFSPALFFRRLSMGRGIREPLAFGLLTGSMGNMLGVFWPLLMISGGFLPFGSHLSGRLTAGLVFLLMAVAIPLSVILTMFVYSGILHLLLMVTGGGKNRFEATFTVVAYSQAAQAWSLVPVVGGWIGGVWRIIILLVGLREIHGTSFLRVVAAFLLPLGILFLMIAAALIYLFM